MHRGLEVRQPGSIHGNRLQSRGLLHQGSFDTWAGILRPVDSMTLNECLRYLLDRSQTASNRGFFLFVILLHPGWLAEVLIELETTWLGVV